MSPNPLKIASYGIIHATKKINSVDFFIRFNNTGDLTYLNTIKSNLLSFLKGSFKLMSGFIFFPPT